MKIEFVLNGREVAVDAPPMKRLLDVLREDLRVTGTKEGCGEGECGACSVLVDGELVTSCLVPVVQASGAEVKTVEGLAKGEDLSRLQRSFLECNGAQCGICTPGMLVAAQYYLDGEGRLPAEDAREALAGNLCRCTGYEAILEAVDAVGARTPREAPAATANGAARKSVKSAVKKAVKKVAKKAAKKAAKAVAKAGRSAKARLAAKAAKKKPGKKPAKRGAKKVAKKLAKKVAKKVGGAKSKQARRAAPTAAARARNAKGTRR